MQLRVFRQFKWVLAVPLSQVQFGGQNPYKLEHTDTLQYYNEVHEDWADVEIVEAPKPPHPNEARQPQLHFPGMEELLRQRDAAANNPGA
jgi:hypothetical protein